MNRHGSTFEDLLVAAAALRLPLGKSPLDLPMLDFLETALEALGEITRHDREVARLGKEALESLLRSDAENDPERLRVLFDVSAASHRASILDFQMGVIFMLRYIQHNMVAPSEKGGTQ